METFGNKMETFGNKRFHKYFCKECDFGSSNVSNYTKHCETKKHAKKNAKKCKKMQKNGMELNCVCGATYKTRSGLWKHAKTCVKQLTGTEENQQLRELLKKKEEELRTKDAQINALIPKIGANIITFNINTFLHHKCKDAISLNEFIQNIQISTDNLLLTSRQGISNGISNIIIENMNKLSIHERPIHCCDKKREVLYVKDDSWHKDNEKRNTKELIKQLCSKQIKSMYILNNTEQFGTLVGTCTSNINEKKVLKTICDNVYVKE